MAQPKDINKPGGQHHVAASTTYVDSSTAREAAKATEAEHNMDFAQSFKLYRSAALWSVFLSSCLIMEGYDTAILNSLYAYPPFQRKFGVQNADGSYGLTAAWQSGLSNGALAGEILGLFANGIIADRFGYRKTLIGALFGCVAFIFIIFFSQNIIQLLIGEILIGIPWGVFQTLTTTYASEVCPTHLRAYLTTYVNLCWVMGQLIAAGVLRGMVSRSDQWGYRIPFALQWIWPVPIMIGVYFAPESPWWLVRKGRLEEAKRSLTRLTTRNTDVDFKIDETVSLMVYTNEMEKETTAGISYWHLFKGINLRRTEIVCMVWMIQPLSGSKFMGFSTYFFESAGMAVSNAFTMSIGQYAIGMVGTISSWFFMGKLGRRTLFLSGQLIQGLVLIIIGCASLAGKGNPSAQWAIGSMLLIFTFVYDCTVGPVCYSLVSELTSTRLKTKSVVLARNMYNMIGIAGNILTTHMLNSESWNWGAKTGFFWGGSCLLCALWTFFRLPEPKGRTYGELEILFERRVSARKFKSTVVERLDVHTEEERLKEKEAEVAMME